MPEVEVPFVDEEIDTDDPSGSLMTVIGLVVGGGVFFMALNYSQRIGNKATEFTDSVLGTDGDTGVDVL